jgi:hypothetical protein
MWNASYLVWILCGHIPNVKQSCIIKEIYFLSLRDHPSFHDKEIVNNFSFSSSPPGTT